MVQSVGLIDKEKPPTQPDATKHPMQPSNHPMQPPNATTQCNQAPNATKHPMQPETDACCTAKWHCNYDENSFLKSLVSEKLTKGRKIPKCTFQSQHFYSTTINRFWYYLTFDTFSLKALGRSWLDHLTYLKIIIKINNLILK